MLWQRVFRLLLRSFPDTLSMYQFSVMFFKKQESYKQGVVASTTLNIFSKAIVFVNSVLLLYLFGANFGTDTYFLITSTVSFVASFLLGIISYVVIPEAMRIRINVNSKAEQAYINFFIWSFSAIGLIIAALVFFGPTLFYSLFSRYPQQTLSQFNSMLLISAVLFPFTFITNLLVFVMSSHKYFTVPMLVSIVNSCISIVLLIVLKNTFGITAAVIAFTSGTVVNLLWLVLVFRRRLQWNFFAIKKPSKRNWQNILLMELNIIPVSLRSFINIYMLSGLGAGIVTSYNYGMQIALIPELMVISQVSAVTSIKLNELSAKGKIAEINQLFFRVMKVLLFGLLPIAIILFLLSGEILEILLTFKNSGDKDFIPVIAAFIACFAITLPGRALDVVISNIMTAQQKIKEGVLYAIFLHLITIVLTVLAIQFYGLKGFYFIVPFVYIVFIPVFYWYFTKKVLPFVELGKWFKESALFFILMSLAGAGLFFLKDRIADEVGLLPVIFIVSFLVVGTCLVINSILKYQRLSFRV